MRCHPLQHAQFVHVCKKEHEFLHFSYCTIDYSVKITIISQYKSQLTQISQAMLMISTGVAITLQVSALVSQMRAWDQERAWEQG